MTVANALKAFFNALNGQEPSGTTIADVINNGAGSVQRNNESALATRVTTLESSVVEYEDDTNKSFVLASSTADSVKTFRITVVDDGTVTATEIVAEGE